MWRLSGWGSSERRGWKSAGAHGSVGGPNGVEVCLDPKSEEAREVQKGVGGHRKVGSHKTAEVKRVRG